MSDTTPRDQLAALLADDWNPDRDPILTAMFRDYAQTILDAGWRPPARTVARRRQEAERAREVQRRNEAAERRYRRRSEGDQS